MNTHLREPKTYKEWIECLAILSERTTTTKEIEILKYGSCPGIESVYNQFFERVQETVNIMLNRIIKNCTRCVNECLAEDDYSNIEVILIRFYKELLSCRFYIHISFLENKDVQMLDEATISEIDRYWQTIKKYFADLSDETNSSELYDMVYFINRLVTKEKANYGKL